MASKRSYQGETNQVKKERYLRRKKNIGLFLISGQRTSILTLPLQYILYFSNFKRSRNITAPHQIFVGISLIFKINGI